MSIRSFSAVLSIFQFFGRYLALFLLITLYKPLNVLSQIPGIINEQGDTINFLGLLQVYEFCIGDCAQFVYIKAKNLPSSFIYYPDDIEWYLKGGVPERPTERNPWVCFPKMTNTDSILLIHSFMIVI